MPLLLCPDTTNFDVIDLPDKEDKLLVILWEGFILLLGMNKRIIQFHVITGKILFFGQFQIKGH